MFPENPGDARAIKNAAMPGKGTTASGMSGWQRANPRNCAGGEESARPAGDRGNRGARFHRPFPLPSGPERTGVRRKAAERAKYRFRDPNQPMVSRAGSRGATGSTMGQPVRALLLGRRFGGAPAGFHGFLKPAEEKHRRPFGTRVPQGGPHLVVLLLLGGSFHCRLLSSGRRQAVSAAGKT